MTFFFFTILSFLLLFIEVISFLWTIADTWIAVHSNGLVENFNIFLIVHVQLIVAH